MEEDEDEAAAAVVVDGPEELAADLRRLEEEADRPAAEAGLSRLARFLGDLVDLESLVGEVEGSESLNAGARRRRREDEEEEEGTASAWPSSSALEAAAGSILCLKSCLPRFPPPPAAVMRADIFFLAAGREAEGPEAGRPREVEGAGWGGAIGRRPPEEVEATGSGESGRRDPRAEVREDMAARSGGFRGRR